MKYVFILMLIFVTSFCGTPDKKVIRIAICQIFCLDGDREGNFMRIENALSEAEDQGAQIACFPETSILGWVNPEAHNRAFPIPGKDSDRLCELAGKYGIFVCIGLAEKKGDDLHDTVILIDDHGEILYRHIKINILSELMTPPYTPGNEVGTTDTKFGRIGVIICADSFRDDILDEMRSHNPELMLIPYGWAAPEDAWPDHGKKLEEVVVNVAEKLNCPVIGTDLVGEISHGPWTGQVYGGQSVAVNKSAEVIARAKDREREILIVDIQL